MRMFIFCYAAENEPKERVQKPTVSKYFPFAQNARGAGVLGAPLPSNLPTPSLSDAAPNCLRRRGLGFPLPAPEDDKVRFKWWRMPLYQSFCDYTGFVVGF